MMEFKDLVEIIAASILALAGFGITSYYSRHTQKLAQDQMMHDLFIRFNERYDRLNGKLVEVQQNFSTPELLNDPANLEYKKAVYDFFNLCAEEHYWANHKKRVDPAVWESWNAGMNYWYNNVPSIQALWGSEKANKDAEKSYYLKPGESFFTKKSK
jgi:hypothetical protein